MKNAKTKAIVATALTGILAAGIGVTANKQEALAEEEGMEKCAGIVKAGMNDCGANDHACSGLSTESGNANEWIYLPEGTCDKIVNGRVVKK
ncbi:MAG: DUF2282 domain-containing protein [Symploca sp. SIO2E6]|nr:DUF2282 domain-containing protein [Symploca sp. SIO2E6]